MDRTEQPDATPVPPIPELEPEHTALRIETEQDGQGKLRRLSLQEMARIAEAVLDDPAMNAAGLAWKMGLSRITVALAAKKVREAGGWYTKIVWKTCIHCGEPLATSGSANGLGPSRYHARCREAHRWQMVKKNLVRQSPLEAEKRKRPRRQYEREVRRRKSSLSGGEHSSVGGAEVAALTPVQPSVVPIRDMHEVATLAKDPPRAYAASAVGRSARTI